MTVSRYINTSDDEMWDFLTRQSAPPGAAIEVPPEQEDAFENHPIWKPVVSLASLGKKPAQDPSASTNNPPSVDPDTNTEAN
jgi:hypothetical protein